jgi:hypothetical protein
MGAAVHQLASASLTALFSVGMLIAAHFFMQYQSARVPSLNAHTIIAPI